MYLIALLEVAITLAVSYTMVLRTLESLPWTAITPFSHLRKMWQRSLVQIVSAFLHITCPRLNLYLVNKPLMPLSLTLVRRLPN